MRPTPIPAKPGQESVWDYPRPARWEEVHKPLKVIFNGIVLAQTQCGKRVVETSHPPTYYFPLEDIRLEYLTETTRRTFCEWKGWCSFYDISVGDKHAPDAAWRYPHPTSDFVAIQDYYAFYASPMDACYVGDEQVIPQAGGLYGGWITADLVGPFKGGPGTLGW